jgi:hypothetical protein
VAGTGKHACDCAYELFLHRLHNGACAPAIQRWVRRRDVRRSLYREVLENWKSIDDQVRMATQDPKMIAGMGRRFALGFKRSSYEMAQRDPVMYYGLKHRERYWVEILYRDAENVITGKFDDDDQRLRNADSVAWQFLSMIKNRNLSRRMIYAAAERPVQAVFDR